MLFPRSLGGRLHLAATVLLVGGLGGFLGLVAGGVLEVHRIVRPPDVPDVPPASGPRVEMVSDGDKFFKMMGVEGHCFRYAGGPVDCWIEVTVDDKRTVLAAGLGSNLWTTTRAAAHPDEPLIGTSSGYILWVRREEGVSEAWDLMMTMDGADGEWKTTSTQRGMKPPEPTKLVRGTGQAPGVGSSRALVPGQEVDLYSHRCFGEGGGNVVRTATLKCRIAAVSGGKP